MEFNKIENCEEYDKKDDLINSSLRCLRCKQGYFLAKGIICIER